MLAERGEPAEGADARQGHLGVVVEAERSVGVAVSRLHELAIFVVHQLRWLRRRHSACYSPVVPGYGGGTSDLLRRDPHDEAFCARLGGRGGAAHVEVVHHLVERPVGVVGELDRARDRA